MSLNKRQVEADGVCDGYYDIALSGEIMHKWRAVSAAKLRHVSKINNVYVYK